MSNIKIKRKKNDIEPNFSNLKLEEKYKYFKELYKNHLVYHNNYFNKYEIKITNFYQKKENLDKYIKLNFGTVVFFKDFPLYDFDKSHDEEYTFKNHYFVIIGKNEDNYYLSYMTTQIEKFQNKKIKNNNYLILNSDKNHKQILITLRKIYVINEETLLKELHNKTCLINKRLNNIANYYLKLLILYSDLYTIEFKSKMKKKGKISFSDKLDIKSAKCNYSKTSNLNSRLSNNKKELILLFTSPYSPVKLINL